LAGTRAGVTANWFFIILISYWLATLGHIVKWMALHFINMMNLLNIALLQNKCHLKLMVIVNSLK
jgi:hypothetical protein